MDETISNTNCENSIKNIDISLVIQKSKVKKVEKKEKLKRVITNTNIFHSLKQDFSFETQFRILNEVSTEYNEENNYHRLFISQIKGKMYGYSYQDEMKNKFIRDEFVDLSNVLQKLIDCKMECYYCKKKVKILYEYVREDDQWTLERIDNKNGHNTHNVEIACLSCNLRRRTMYHERYLFTKQMNIIKL
jgi:5-methylcytosine-specific restriction endonuclease McrA